MPHIYLETEPPPPNEILDEGWDLALADNAGHPDYSLYLVG